MKPAECKMPAQAQSAEAKASGRQKGAELVFLSKLLNVPKAKYHEIKGRRTKEDDTCANHFQKAAHYYLKADDHLNASECYRDAGRAYQDAGNTASEPEKKSHYFEKAEKSYALGGEEAIIAGSINKMLNGFEYATSCAAWKGKETPSYLARMGDILEKNGDELAYFMYLRAAEKTEGKIEKISLLKKVIGGNCKNSDYLGNAYEEMAKLSEEPAAIEKCNALAGKHYSQGTGYGSSVQNRLAAESYMKAGLATDDSEKKEYYFALAGRHYALAKKPEEAGVAYHYASLATNSKDRAFKYEAQAESNFKQAESEYVKNRPAPALEWLLERLGKLYNAGAETAIENDIKKAYHLKAADYFARSNNDLDSAFSLLKAGNHAMSSQEAEELANSGLKMLVGIQAYLESEGRYEDIISMYSQAENLTQVPQVKAICNIKIASNGINYSRELEAEGRHGEAGMWLQYVVPLCGESVHSQYYLEAAENFYKAKQFENAIECYLLSVASALDGKMRQLLEIRASLIEFAFNSRN
ncbi:MAG: hypothetical protein WC506_06720 [Candidatus Micrarchaeia archaeon]